MKAIKFQDRPLRRRLVYFLVTATLVTAIARHAHGQVPACDLPGNLLPPPTATHHFAGDVSAAGSPVVIRDLTLSQASSSQAPPAAGTTQVLSCTMSATGRLSTNNGTTFAPFAATADVNIRTTAHAPGEPFDTEMLMLNLSLPGGVMLRESPTRASTGKTSIRAMSGGSHRIDSFFDVFTELSMDGGQSWTGDPDSDPCPMYGCPRELATSSPNLPSASGVCRAAMPLRFDTAVGRCLLRNVSVSDPLNPQPPPPPGGSQTVNTPMSVCGELSLDNGATFAPFTATATAVHRVTSHLEDGDTRYFDTEMLALDITGGSLPAGFRLRESPTLPSKGRTSVRTLAPGIYRIGSFFDIFTELSLDNGSTWQPAKDGVCRMTQDGTRREHHFLTNCFPQSADYACDEDQETGFAGTGVVLRRVGLRSASRAREVPPAGVYATRTLDGEIEFEISTDGGATFTRHHEPVWMECFLTSYSVTLGGSNDRPMETLSLNFTCPGPTPVMIRESPTRASTGRHSVRAAAGGGHMVDSFFDIFTEVSLDGGGTWSPAHAPLNFTLLPYLEQDNVFRCAMLPPRDGSLETRKLANPVPFRVQGDPMHSIRNMRLRDLGLSAPPPEPCDGQVVVETTATADLELSTDGGSTWAPHTCDCTVSLRLAAAPVEGATGVFDTEMLAMDLSGGTLSAAIRLRESPTLPSKGRARLMEEEGIYFRIDSFFDVFTELSIDSGTNWTPADDACHLELHAKPEGPLAPSNWLPLAVQYRETDFHFAIPFGEQAEIRGLHAECQSPLCTADRAPAPAPGSALTRTMTTPFACDVSLDGGATHHRASGSAALTISFSDMSSDGGGWTLLSGEILQFDATLTGTGLPGGVMIRESPTRASTGRTAYRPAGAAYRIDSFFDIFTELSIDGGANWTPACKSLRLEALPAAGKGVKQATAGSIIAGSFRGGPADLTLRCANGLHIKSAELLVRKQGTDQHDYLVPLPSPAMLSTAGLDATLQLEYSPDGVTFTRIEAPVYFRFEMKEVMVDSIQWSCTNEVTVFESSGGSFPPGMLLRQTRRPGRESPTLRSVGRTTSTPLPDGQFQIDSFFDIFTELSIDGGDTWHEFDLPLHLELQQPGVQGTAPATPWPPPGNLRTPPGDPDFDLLFADGSSCSFFDIFTEFFGPGSLPFEGLASSNISFPAVVTLDLTTPGGPPVHVTCPATIDTVVTRNQPATSDGTWFFDTEMLALNLTSGLPPNVRVRESPTKASTGRTSLRPPAGGVGGGGIYAIDSFFDIFTEISLDDGATWAPAHQAVRVAYAKPSLAVNEDCGSDVLTAASLPPTLVSSTSKISLFACNLGDATLRLGSLSFSGADAALFSASTPESSVEPGSNVPLTIVFAPDSPGLKSAVLQITNNDPDHTPCQITLTGRAFLRDEDDDGDGVTNAQELARTDCGFDPAVSNADLLEQLRTDGFFRGSDMHSLALGRPVLERDPATGMFHLQLGVLKSPDLGNWSPLTGFTLTQDPGTGLLDLGIAPDGSTSQWFFQVFGEESPAP